MAAIPITKMVIASKLNQVPRVQQAILDQVREHGHGRDAIFAIRLALEEALSNAIRHGNGGDPEKKVTVEYAVTDRQIRISVTDEGCGFDPATVPDPRTRENLMRPCGRGILLMRAYMSKVAYNRRGNRVTMTLTRK